MTVIRWIQSILLSSLSLCLLHPVSAQNLNSDEIESAEVQYKSGHFDLALPLYKSAAEAANLSLADRIKRLRLLGDCYCKCGKAQDALAVFKQVESLLPPDDSKGKALNDTDQAACQMMLGNFDAGEKLIRSASSDGSRLTGKDLKYLSIKTTAIKGYADYLRSRWADAAKGFEQTLTLNETSPAEPRDKMALAEKLNFALAGTYYHLGNYREARDHFQRMNDLDAVLFGKDDLQSGWSHLALSDCYHRLGDQARSRSQYTRAVWIFRKFNRDQLVEEYAGKLDGKHTRAELEAKLTSSVFGSMSSNSSAAPSEPPLFTSHVQAVANHDPCSGFVRPFEDSPGRVWVNPWIVPHKAIIIGVHGLSLQHSSYDALARKLADAGYIMVAFDMRGFGVYRQALGADQLDFAACMNDLEEVVRAVRADGGNLPVFMLGESMGGAIAVQFSAQHPELVDGLVASVPAGKRYKETKTVLKVAVEYLKDRNHQFNIGTDVINQATSDPKLKAEWANDPLTRSDLSARELIRFQAMCNKNLEYARQLINTPVLVFQGVADKLVKPQATYELFQTIASKDKSLVIVGNAEHLILEEGCFAPSVLSGLLSWLDSHLKMDKVSAVTTSAP